MEFHEINAVGPIKVERLSALPTFNVNEDSARIVYITTTGKLYYGDYVDGNWVEFNDSSLLAAHIALTTAHNASGAIIGATTFSAHTSLTTAHNSNGVVAGMNDVNDVYDLLETHEEATTVHNSNGHIAGQNDITTITNAINAHKALTSNTHGASGAIYGITNINDVLTAHTEGSPLHSVSSLTSAGFLHQLPTDNAENLYINGLGVWTVGSAQGGTIGPQGPPGPRGETGPNGTPGTSGTYSGTSGSSGTCGAAGSNGTSGTSGRPYIINSSSTSILGANISLTAGTWMVCAWFTAHHDAEYGATFTIDGAPVDIIVNQGDPFGTNNCHMFGYKEVTGPKNITAVMTPQVGGLFYNHLTMIQAILKHN